jgi:hypothetical protein
MHGRGVKIIEKCVPKRRHNKIQTSGNQPKERIQHSQHGEKFKIKAYTDCNTEQNGSRFAAAPRGARHGLQTG